MSIKYVLIPVLFIIVFCIPIVSFSETIQLPQTGQTKSYISGDDGYYRTGIPWPSTRFSVETSAGSECIVDNLTGLMWPRNGNLPGKITYNDALQFSNDLVLCGYSDWRVPNIIELNSLINASASNLQSWLQSQGFLNIIPNYYWSSTHYPSGSSLWTFLMTEAKLQLIVPSLYFYLLPVRGGQTDFSDPNYPANLRKTGQNVSYAVGDDADLQMGVTWPTPRFTDNNDGTVTDNLTLLMWTRDYNIPGPEECTTGFDKTWAGSFKYIECLNANNFLNHSDWRVPNLNESFSLLDYSKLNYALPQDHPFITPSVDNAWVYWTSTTPASQTKNAYVVNIRTGNDQTNISKSSSLCNVWPVRGGFLSNSIVGSWSAQGQKKDNISITGQTSINTKTSYESEFEFNEDGTFHMDIVSGTWIKEDNKFVVKLDPSSLASYYENTFSEDNIYVDITVLSASFTCKLQRDGTIKGKMAFAFNLVSLENGALGKANLSRSFTGTRTY